MNIVGAYIGLVDDIVATTGFSQMLLHLIIGPAIYVLARLAIPRAPRIVPLQLVLVIELINEIMDRLYYGRWRWPDTIMDVVLTMAGPCVLAILWNAAIASARR